MPHAKGGCLCAARSATEPTASRRWPSHSGKLAHRRQSIASDPIDPRFTSQAVHFRTAANIEATSNSSREGPNALIPVRIPTRTLFTCPLPV